MLQELGVSEKDSLEERTRLHRSSQGRENLSTVVENRKEP